MAPLLGSIAGIVDALDDREAVVVRDFLRAATRAVEEFAEDPAG